MAKARILLSACSTIFFSHHALREMEVFLTADNCSGKNKNNIMLSYLAWRTTTKRHSRITLSFLVVGHNKFTPDWCFGLLKRKFRQTHVTILTGISEVVNHSAHCNYSQLVSRVAKVSDFIRVSGFLAVNKVTRTDFLITLKYPDFSWSKLDL